MKRCRRCGEDLSLEELNKSSRLFDGYQHWCKPCFAEYHRLKAHNISVEEYDVLYTIQQGRCAICGAGGALVIDHNHETGKVRGLLCNECNLGLGKFHDRLFLLHKAAEYLDDTNT